jgi:hypothetical protein
MLALGDYDKLDARVVEDTAQSAMDAVVLVREEGLHLTMTVSVKGSGSATMNGTWK